MLTPYAIVHVNVTLLGNGVFADGIKVRLGRSSGLGSVITGVLTRRGKFGYIHTGRTSRDNWDKYCSDAAASQGKPGVDGHHHKLGGGTEGPCPVSEGA